MAIEKIPLFSPPASLTPREKPSYTELQNKTFIATLLWLSQSQEIRSDPHKLKQHTSFIATNLQNIAERISKLFPNSEYDTVLETYKNCWGHTTCELLINNFSEDHLLSHAYTFIANLNNLNLKLFSANCLAKILVNKKQFTVKNLDEINDSYLKDFVILHIFVNSTDALNTIREYGSKISFTPLKDRFLADLGELYSKNGFNQIAKSLFSEITCQRLRTNTIYYSIYFNKNQMARIRAFIDLAPLLSKNQQIWLFKLLQMIQLQRRSSF